MTIIIIINIDVPLLGIRRASEGAPQWRRSDVSP
jgi:hypothetical protein